MDFRPAHVDYSEEQWSWPSWKFNLSLDALFTGLYDQYNTIPIPIQEPIAFHHDVVEVCSIATTVDQFHSLLKGRRDQRVSELRQCWDAVSTRIASSPSLLEGNKDDASVDI